MISCLLAVLIELTGVTGADLRARAFFNANNVTVGDPMMLTVDFIGTAEFHDLHPPKLSSAVDAADWKIDEASAKTGTYDDARRLTYRVRPMREGVLRFPAMEFAYSGTSGERRIVRSNEIPVHARHGEQVVVAELDSVEIKFPEPPELLPVPEGADDELAFAWRKALAKPSAEAFAAFDGVEARMNEATMAVREGNWSRAMSIYRTLEWKIGQTGEIERGIVAALAVKNDSPYTELPVWRQVLRPLLRFAWLGRIGITLGLLALVTLVFWGLGKLLKFFAAFALVAFLTSNAFANTVETTVTTNANGAVTTTRITKDASGRIIGRHQSTIMTSGGGNFSVSFGGNANGDFDFPDPFGHRRAAKRPPAKIDAAIAFDKREVSIAESFLLVLSLEMPKSVVLSEMPTVVIDEIDKVTQLGEGKVLRVERSGENPENVVQRFVMPMRANEAFEDLHFHISGKYVFNDEDPFFRAERSFMTEDEVAKITIRPLPAEGRPDDFSGIVAESVNVREECDLKQVMTNDVVTITYTITARGYVPPRYEPKDVAFEWSRGNLDAGCERLVFRRYFVADGAPKTPEAEIAYYDINEKRYRRVKFGGTALKYDIIEEK